MRENGHHPQEVLERMMEDCLEDQRILKSIMSRGAEREE
jgi:hypothetical protein